MQNFASLASAERYVDTELLDLWKEFYDKEWCQHPGEEWGKMQRPLGQVIPAWKALESSDDVARGAILPGENMEEIIRGAETIAVAPCSCRRPLCLTLYENPPNPPLAKGGKGGFSYFVVPEITGMGLYYFSETLSLVIALIRAALAFS